MIPLLLCLTAAQPAPPVPAPAARLLERLSQRAQALLRGTGPDLSQIWRRELDLEALNAAALIDRPELSAAERTQLQVALQNHLEARARAQAPALEGNLSCNFGGARWVQTDPHLELSCQLGQRPLRLELWVTPKGRVADVAVDQVRLSRSLRAQLNRSLRTRGFNGTLERLRRPYLAASG